LKVPGVVSAFAVESLSDSIPARFIELFFADSSGVSNATLAERVRIQLLEYRAGGIYVQLNTSRPVIESLTLRLRFRTGVDTSRLRDEIRNSCVEFINSLGVNEPLLRADIAALLSRFKADGLVVDEETIVAPVGD